MNRALALLLSCCLLLSACTAPSAEAEATTSPIVESTVTPQPEPTSDSVVATPQPTETMEPAVIVAEPTVQFDKLNDPDLLPYMEDLIYDELVTALDSEDYFVENISAVYYSKEYLEEVMYNSQENIYFGYTLSELAGYFQGTQYVFTVDDDGNTIVQPFEEYDDSYDQMVTNVMTGTGVILVSVTVSVVTGGVAPAVSMVLAVSAKTGTIAALSSGALSGAIAGITTGIATDDMDEAIKAAAVAGSDSFKWGAITGILSGGIGQAVALKGATLGGLTMNEAAIIQRESKYPLELIKQFSSMDQYELCKEIGLTTQMVSGKTSLIQAIDLNYVDDLGNTNLQRMALGQAPLDATETAYQLHHVGQKVDSPLAILTYAQHMQDGNNSIWHIIGQAGEVHIDEAVWTAQRKAYWKDFAQLTIEGLI